MVRQVEYHADTDDFTVKAKNLETDAEDVQRFTHVIVATGIFNTPNVPSFPGIDEFPGRVLHAHDFKNGREFEGKRILCIGASYSAEDLSMQTLKYGAKKVTTCWRSKPMGFKFPTGIDERPCIERFEGKTAYFKDGSSGEYDVVLLCTGYKKHFPFLPDNLRLTGGLTVYPDNLYKGTVWVKGGNDKLLYLGTQDQYYTFTMFDVQALWALRYIMGAVKAPSHDEMLKHLKKWTDREATLKGCHDDIDFQTDFILDLCKDVGYDERTCEGRALFHDWEDKKQEDISTYRDIPYKSVITGTMGALHHTTWLKAFDDTTETFVNQTPNKITQ